jgi:hypothetical protein
MRPVSESQGNKYGDKIIININYKNAYENYHPIFPKTLKTRIYKTIFCQLIRTGVKYLEQTVKRG